MKFSLSEKEREKIRGRGENGNLHSAFGATYVEQDDVDDGHDCWILRVDMIYMDWKG